LTSVLLAAMLTTSGCRDDDEPIIILNGQKAGIAFTGYTATAGQELWVSDGTEGGTTLVKDINLGNLNGIRSSQFHKAGLNGEVYFAADDGINGMELWKSDGTEAGTVMVKDINLSGSSSPSFYDNGFKVMGATLYFTADDGTNGIELWKTDGTAAGTVMVKDIATGLTGSSPAYLSDVNGTLFFRAYDSTSGYELWKSDGTAAGTVMVKDISTACPFPPCSSYPWYLTNVNGILYFQASDGTNGSELWKSDGTAAGTVMVKDIASGTASGSPHGLTDVNGTLFFQANDGTNGYELWKSDGTAAGTVMVKDIYTGLNSSSPYYFTNVNGTLYFRANDSTNGFELWKSDGTEAGTVMVKDIWPSTGNSFPEQLTNVNGTLYFSADDGTAGRELWKSDGTAAGTVMVKDINTGAVAFAIAIPGAPSSRPSSLISIDGTLYFSADNGSNGRELWKSDGTDAGTLMVKDVEPGLGHGFQGMMMH
jgi:ELWxxDGT repeat protein